MGKLYHVQTLPRSKALYNQMNGACGKFGKFAGGNCLINTNDKKGAKGHKNCSKSMLDATTTGLTGLNDPKVRIARRARGRTYRNSFASPAFSLIPCVAVNL